MSDSPGLADFVIGLVNSVLNLPDGQAKIFRRITVRQMFYIPNKFLPTESSSDEEKSA